MAFTRRELAPLLLGAAGLAWPRPARAEVGPEDRKFLFILANGGWDPAMAFAANAPDTDDIWTDELAQVATSGGVDFVDSPLRPAVGEFFTRHGPDLAVLNGVEVRSVTHERCRRLVLTGHSESGYDDWPAQLAGAQRDRYDLPGLVASGPSYTQEFSGSVTRLGNNSQLAALLDGRALFDSEQPVEPLSTDSRALVDAWLATRHDSVPEGAFRDALVESELQAAALRTSPLDLSAGGFGTITMSRLRPVLDAFQQGLSRCALLEHNGQFEANFDSHGDIHQHNEHFQVLFTDLLWLMEELATRPGLQGGSLAEETVVVVYSEMGRGARMNSLGGKDHWTFTSSMLLGPGVATGQTVGAYDDALVGQEVGGVRLTSRQLGATVLALGGVTPDIDPIEDLLA